MAFWNKKPKTGSIADVEPETLYLDAPTAAEADIEDINASDPQDPVETVVVASDRSDTSELLSVKPSEKPSIVEDAEVIDVTTIPDSAKSPEPVVLPLSEKPVRKLETGKIGKTPKDLPGYAAEWLSGIKGRAINVFIGFLPDVSKKDAVSFAKGVANRHASDQINTSYAVYRYNNGWAYEVQEGGPRRAYLPAILKRFDDQAGAPITDKSAAIIETATRKIKVERTPQSGVVAYLMPESYAGEQSEWLEPGPKLVPVAPLHLSVVIVGAAIFASGILAFVTVLATRPAAPPLNAPARIAMPYDSLPISQWKKLLDAYAQGQSVDSLRLKNGKWTIVHVGDTVTKSVKTKSTTAGVKAVPSP